MERLTHEADFGFDDCEQILYEVPSDKEGSYDIYDIAMGFCLHDDEQYNRECQEILENISLKLKHYEELEEKGLLVELPCKVDDTVWCINKNNKQPYCETVGYFYIDENGISFINKGEDSNYEFGKDAFILCAEAEQALADMK